MRKNTYKQMSKNMTTKITKHVKNDQQNDNK